MVNGSCARAVLRGGAGVGRKASPKRLPGQGAGAPSLPDLLGSSSQACRCLAAALPSGTRVESQGGPLRFRPALSTTVPTRGLAAARHLYPSIGLPVRFDSQR